MNTEGMKQVLYVVALAMGVASILSSILGNPQNIGLFLGIGVSCLAFAGFYSKK